MIKDRFELRKDGTKVSDLRCPWLGKKFKSIVKIFIKNQINGAAGRWPNSVKKSLARNV